ncbi:MAG: NAD(P)/FAD-dependent oxidoreductase [Planctomycetales bacterium]|nr:NAD(P)/FAD-dependent oxidoreductase [Planctomycetales bacterium]
MRDTWDVIVIGAGAAGMFAATRAALRGKRVLLLEKNSKPGVKILMSGGTRCNLTHATDRRGIIDAFGPAGRFLHSALAALGPEELVAEFNAQGVATKVEATGKVFPASNRALDVASACRRMLESSGARLVLGEPVLDVSAAPHGFEVKSHARCFTAPAVILTTGGMSYPGCGTTGDGYAWAKQLGHKIVPPRPALAPLTSSESWLHQLKGVALPDVQLAVGLTGAPIADRRRGSLLFTHFGLSGPAAMDISRAVTSQPSAGWLLTCDFAPDTPRQVLADSLASEGKKSIAGALSSLLPRRLAEGLLVLEGVSPHKRVAELSKKDLTRLVAAIKQLTISITGTLGFKKAEVTAGGVALDEVDSRSMQSKIMPGLFLAGEVLDLDGPIGGYNFQAAFSTGWLAGEKV